MDCGREQGDAPGNAAAGSARISAASRGEGCSAARSGRMGGLMPAVERPPQLRPEAPDT